IPLVVVCIRCRSGASTHCLFCFSVLPPLPLYSPTLSLQLIALAFIPSGHYPLLSFLISLSCVFCLSSFTRPVRRCRRRDLHTRIATHTHTHTHIFRASLLLARALLLLRLFVVTHATSSITLTLPPPPPASNHP